MPPRRPATTGKPRRARTAGGPGSAAGARGARGMRERAELYGGTLDAGPCPDGGFLVTAALPYGAAAGAGAGHQAGDGAATAGGPR